MENAIKYGLRSDGQTSFLLGVNIQLSLLGIVPRGYTFLSEQPVTTNINRGLESFFNPNQLNLLGSNQKTLFQ